MPASRISRSAVALALAGTAAAAAPAVAAIAEPPTGGNALTIGLNTSFVAAEGMTPGTDLVAEVWRAGLKVAETDAAVVDPGGLVEFNHLGVPCWDGITPDFRPGDQVRVVEDLNRSTGVASTLRDLTATAPALAAPGVVTVRGSGRTATGAPLPLAELDVEIREGNLLRLIAPGTGTLTPDAPGSAAFTATFSGLSAPDQATALAATRVEATWLRGSEAQIFGVGEPAGPVPGCAAPLAEPAGKPDLLASRDTGASSSDDVTANPVPLIVGSSSPDPDADAGLDVRLVDTVTGSPVELAAGTVADFGGSYAFAPAAPLAEGRHVLTVMQKVDGVEIPGQPLTVTVDLTAPAAPSITASTPPSGGDGNAPAVRGTAEGGSTVRLYSGPGCAGAPVAVGTAAAFAGAGLTVNVADNSTTVLSAAAEDAAGNASGCSATFTYTEVTPPAAGVVPTATTAVTTTRTAPAPLVALPATRLAVAANGSVRLALRCTAPAASICAGRLELRAGTAVIGAKAFAVRGGRRTSITVTLTAKGRALVARGAVTVRARIAARAGTGRVVTRIVPVTLAGRGGS